MSDVPFDRDRPHAPPTTPPAPRHGPDEVCTCADEANPEAAEFLAGSILSELSADLVLIVGPITGGAACLASPHDPITVGRILNSIGDDLIRQGASRS